MNPPGNSSISPVLNTAPSTTQAFRMSPYASDGTLPEYDSTDMDYMKGLQSRLQNANIQRSRQYEEFDFQTYLQRYADNRRKAASIITPKKNEGDVVVTAGTLESKLDAVLSAINNLNLSPELHAYDEKDNKINLASDSLTDIMEQVAEYDEDEEKMMLRQRELLVQGEVFVEERWVQYFKQKKNLNNKFTGAFKNEWSTRLEKFYEGPTRIVKYGPNIYLGDITQFDMKAQPFLFEVYADGYENLKAIFGNWEMWKYVPRKFTPVAVTQANGGATGDVTYPSNHSGQSVVIDYRWLLNTQNVDECEVIVYQDRWNDEYNIIINGVMMLPAGFPLSEISPNGEYTIEKQVFKSTNAHFAYGRGFIQTAQQTARLLDEMLKLAILKTRRSFQPPYINKGKKAISPRVLQAGQITMGVDPQALVAIGELSEGVTSSEFQMISKMTDMIDKMTVSPQFAGQQGKANTTATEVMELQRQAKMTLGLVVYACTQLERKIAYLRLWNVMENWFKPIDKKTLSVEADDGAGNKTTTTTTQNVYRTASRSREIPGAGRGQRQTIPMDGKLPTSPNIRLQEFKDQNIYGYPVKKIFLKPTDLKDACKKWFIVIVPKEKESSDFNKAMFRQEIADALSLMQFGVQPNPGELEDEFARVWDKDAGKFFVKRPAGAAPTPPGMMPNGQNNQPGVPVPNNVAPAPAPVQPAQ